MTRDEILTMEAGREMDALIETHLFLRQVEMWKRPGKPDVIQISEYGGPQEWSTDIEQAWVVVEKLQSLGYWVSINTTCDEDVYDIQIARKGSMLGEALVFQKSAQLAICRAALLAVMEIE